MNTLILEDTEFGETPMDVYQKLAGDRILFITNYISDEVATDLVATLLLKDSEAPDKKITLFINSQGGDIRNILMIYDVMLMLSTPIETICMGAAMGEAVLLLVAGTPGLRMATKNSIMTVSQLMPDFTTHTNLTDAKNLMVQLKNDNDRLFEILNKSTKKPVKQLKEDFDRKVYFTPAKALKYGLIDKIIQHHSTK